MSDFNNYENPYKVREYVHSTLVPFIYQVLVDSYGYTSEDYDNDDTHDHVWQIIDGLEDVIYNYQARKISQAFDYDPFTSESEFTGERFNSWNEIAFEIIYNKFHDQYSAELV